MAAAPAEAGATASGRPSAAGAADQSRPNQSRPTGPDSADPRGERKQTALGAPARANTRRHHYCRHPRASRWL